MDHLVNEDATSPDQSHCTAHVRNLTPEEIAALDVNTVAKNNSAALEELMKTCTSTLD